MAGSQATMAPRLTWRATQAAATGPRKAAARASSDLVPALSRPNSAPNISWPAAAAISSAAASGSSVGSVRGRGYPIGSRPFPGLP
ncbi:MAG TPA: hypothetical protein VFQ68_11760 [Streptosporangiaceae bacterium]|nr:hypothetical protein [Streptosporangiaceae bacterium]